MSIKNNKNIFSLNNKTIVIFGGTGNMGLNFSSILAKSGAKVYLLDLKKKKIDNIQITFYKCDVTKINSVKRALNKIIKKEKNIDTLIYNVYAKPKEYYEKFQSYKLKTWEKVLQVNLTGAFLATQEIINHFIKKKIKGNIILISSTYGIVGPDPSIYQNLQSAKNIYGGKFSLNTPAAYTTTKSALIGLSKYIATNFGAYGIRANTLTPGGVFDGQEKKFVERYIKKVPLKRMAKWEDYEGAILFLASDASSYMTGSNLVIDGGWTAW